ncbi:MAG: type I glyceraldehyde-3-phosphate dehydrogenase [Candidatus Liptonbacteria bacterium]|nr:type I glyceraldehyde-3-phosphate dehydrogenase [Candidatus Liptonbacteria bacterium]
MTKAKIAINGFGRIGRLFFRAAFDNQEFEIVAINDLGNLDNLAYLLKYDTIYGRYEYQVSSIKYQEPKANETGKIVVNGKEIAVLQIKNPTQLPWKDLGIDIVIEATGIFESYEKAKVHLSAGAKRVIITAPAKDPEGEGKTVLMGINGGDIKTTALTSNGSCTTNAVAPAIQIMSENPGIQKAILNTIHGYTATQNLVDGAENGEDYRRGRAAAQNIVPSTTGAAIAVTRVIKELDKKFDGISIRVPVASGSIADVTFLAKRKVTVEEINDIFRKAAAEPRWQGILKVTEDQIVSSDIVGEPYAAIIDLKFTKVVDGDLVKIFSWYDNEWGYVSTLLRHVKTVAEAL